jgi:hypothetical protein
MHAQKQIKQTKSSDTGNGRMQLFFLSFFLPFTGRELWEQNIPSLQLSLSFSLIFYSCTSKERQEQMK